MKSRPVFFRISRNRRKAASAPATRPKALSGSIAKYSRGLALSALAGSAALLAVSALLSVQSAQAANIILYDGDTSVFWATGGNWTGGVAPTNNLTTDIAKFDLATYTFQPTATSNGNINGIIMGASSGAITITTTTLANRLNIGDGGIVMDAGTGTLTIGIAATQGVTLGASQSWTNNSSSLLTVSSVANDANVTPFTLTLDGSGSGGITISNVIANGGATGTTALIVNMSGTGVVTLSGANSLTGGIALNQGTLVATVAGAFGTSANTLTFGGGNLDLQAGTNVALTYTGALNLNSTNQTIYVNTAAATAGLTHLVSGALTLGTQTTTVSAGSNINADTNYGLTLSGAKTFAAANSNATFTINGNGNGNGTLSLITGSINTGGFTQTLTFNSGSGSGVRSAVIAGAFTGSNGILDLAGNAPVTINALTTTGNAVRVSGTGTYTFAGASTFTGGVILNNASATVIATVAGGLGATSGKVKFNVAGTTLNLRAATGISYTSGIDSTSFGGTIISEPATNVTGVTQTMTLANTLGTNTIIMSPGQTLVDTAYGLTLSGANSFSAASTNATFTINGNGTGAGTLTMSGGFDTGGNTQTLTFNNGSGSGANKAVISGAITGSNGTLVLAGSAPVTVGALTGTANAVQVNSTTGGIYTFNGASTFSGGVSLNNGTLVLGTSSVVTAGALVSSPVGTGTFQIGTASQAVILGTNAINTTTRTVSNAISLNNDVTFTTSAATGRIAHNVVRDALSGNALTTPNTFTLNKSTIQLTAASGMTVDLIGAIGEANAGTTLTLTGGGTWNIGSTGTPESIANTYTGLTTVSAGNVTLNKTANVDAIAGNLTINGTGTVTLGANIENIKNTSIVTVSTGGTLAMSGRSETIATLILTGGTVSTTSGTLTASNTFDLQAGIVSSALAGSVGAAKTTAGTVTLSGTNTFNGGLRLEAGTLGINNDTALGTGTFQIGATTGSTAVTFDANATRAITNAVNIYQDFTFTGTAAMSQGTGAVTLFKTPQVTTSSATNGLTIGGVIDDGASTFGLTKAGTGTLTLSNAANTYGGVTTITGGTLSVGTLADGGNPSGIGNSSSAAANLVLDGGTLRYTGVAVATNRAFTVTANGGGIDHSPTSAGLVLTIDGTPVFSGTGNRMFTLSGTGTGLNTINGAIVDPSSGATSLTKTGSGSWTLAGNNTFSGSLFVNQGTLVLGGDNTSSSFGLFLNGGLLQVSTNANLGATSGQITVLSDSTVRSTGNVTASRQINLTAGTLIFGSAGFTFSTDQKVTGGGNISVFRIAGGNNAVTLSSASNDFTGSITIDANTNGGTNNQTLNIASLVDGVGYGNIRFGTVAAATTLQTFNYTGASNLNLANRRIEFFNSGLANGTLTSTTNAINVSTDLLVPADSTSAKTLILSAPTGVTSTFSGKILNGTGTTVVALTKSGVGTWVLSGANTYTGATTVSAGTLIARSGSAFGTTSTANVTVATQTGMSYYAATDTALNIGGTLGITGGTATVIGGSIGATTTSARINVAGNATTDAAAIKVNIYGNSFSGTTSGTNTYTLIQGLAGGATNLSTATYTLGTVFNATNFTVTSGPSATTTDVTVGITAATALTGDEAYWRGTATAGLTKVWAASNGSADSNWAKTAGGSVQSLVPGSAANVFIAASPTVAATTTTLGADMTIKTLNIQDTTNGLGLNADGYTLTITPASSAVGITMDASVPASTIAANVAMGAAQTWTNNSANSLTVSGRVSGAFALTTAGTGTQILSGANTYSGGTNINAGTLSFANGSLGTTGNITFTGNSTLQWNGSNTQDVSSRLVMTNAVTSTFDTNGNNVILASAIGSSTSGALTKTGAGTLTLSGPNTYTGLTSVSVGTLEVTANNALGTNAAGTSVTTGATLKLTGVNYSTAEGLTINGTGVGGTAGALASSGTSTFAGLITAATSATINAISGTLELSGGLVKNGTTLTFTGAGAFTISSVISGASANSDLVVDATTVTLTAANTYNGPTEIKNGGTLNANILDALPLSPRSAMSFTGSGTSTLSLGANQVVASLASTGAATVTLGSNTLTVGAGSGSTIFAGSIGGTNGNLIKDGASTQVLTGTNNTFTGTTTVSAGTLEVQGSLSGTTAVTVNTSGTLLLNSAASPIINTAATMTVGGGTVKIDNSLSNTNQTFGSLTLTGTSILDFGTGSNGNTMTFSSLSFTGTKLNVYNWSGSAYGAGVADTGSLAGDTQDRLLFNADTIYSGTSDSRIEFFSDGGTTSLGFGQEVAFGSQFELVPITAVPEPATTALIGSIALCALIGYRERRRFTGFGKRMAARK